MKKLRHIRRMQMKICGDVLPSDRLGKVILHKVADFLKGHGAFSGMGKLLAHFTFRESGDEADERRGEKRIARILQ